MTRVATVLYEDKMQPVGDGAFPPHDLVLALVKDRCEVELHELHKRVDKSAKKGIGNIIKELARTDLLAGAGMLFILVDRDRVAEHVKLKNNAPTEQIVAKLAQLSDAPQKLSVHFLDKHMEDLLKDLHQCKLGEPVPTAKNLNARDIYLKKAAKTANKPVRDCLRDKQPSLAELADKLCALATA